MKQRKRISLDWLDRGRTALEPLLALAYPRHCPLCGTVLEQSAWKAAVCRSCIPEAERLRHLPPRLPVTEHAFYAVNTCAAAFYYADSVRHAILLCKENGNPWYARELADLMAVLIFGAQPARAPGYRPVYENLSGISLYSAIVPGLSVSHRLPTCDWEQRLQSLVLSCLELPCQPLLYRSGNAPCESDI